MKHALRRLLASPGFTLTALVTLALGIGVNTSMFSALRTLVVRTLPFPEGDRLVRVHKTIPQANANPHSPASFLDQREQNTVFTHMAALQATNINLTEPDRSAERLRGMLVTADFFPLLGVAPALGRVFTAEEDQPGANGVVVLSHETWAGRFGRDPAIIGRQLRLGGVPVTVIGVMPATFNDLLLFGPIDMWRPMAFTDAQRTTRRSSWLTVIARLKPGVSLAVAQNAMNTLADQHARAWPDVSQHNGLRLVPLSRGSEMDADGHITWFIVGLAGFVLLIACANLANLQFARTAARGREHAIRAALGASRARLMREVLAESMLLALAGGVLGVLVALWCNDALGRRIFIPPNHTGIALPLDLGALGFALLISTATGILFGLLPAWLASRANVSDALKQGARGTTAGRAQHRVRHALIVVEVGLALVLLASAAFFVGGLQRFAQRDLGWAADRLITAQFNIGTTPEARATPERLNAHRVAIAERWVERVSRIPGVESAAVARNLPTWSYGNNARIALEGQPPAPAGLEPVAFTPSVTPGFFATLGLRLLEGRGFTAADRADQPLVTVINETMARTLWPGESPIGKRVGSPDPANRMWREVVGVVSDARSISLAEVQTPFQMYRPFAQAPESSLTLAVRTRRAPETVATELRRAGLEIDPSQPVYSISTVREGIALSLGNLELAGWMLAGFALLGLGIAALGIYAVIAHSVVQRTHEIGIRIALGAQVRDVLSLVVGQGLRLAVAGVALGLAGAWAISRLLGAILPALPTATLATSASVASFLLVIAALACWLPARRAVKVDPVVALRAE